MKYFKTCITIIVFLIFLIPTAWSSPYLTPEPPLASQMNWDLSPSGMLHISYDLDFNGKADFHTLRVVVTSFYSDQTVMEIGANFPNLPVFYTPYESQSFYYVATAQPLFYSFDVDEDGTWDIMYKDISKDSVNGNEVFYESPSGMFTNDFNNF
jgi:hypothetical protein